MLAEQTLPVCGKPPNSHTVCTPPRPQKGVNFGTVCLKPKVPGRHEILSHFTMTNAKVWKMVKCVICVGLQRKFPAGCLHGQWTLDSVHSGYSGHWTLTPPLTTSPSKIDIIAMNTSRITKQCEQAIGINHQVFESISLHEYTGVGGVGIHQQVSKPVFGISSWCLSVLGIKQRFLRRRKTSNHTELRVQMHSAH